METGILHRNMNLYLLTKRMTFARIYFIARVISKMTIFCILL